MSTMLEECVVDCPYCGEPMSLEVDCSGGSQDLIEDCTVCCNPIELRLFVDDHGRLVRLTARRDDE